MSVKRTKVSDGVFTSEAIHVDTTKPRKGDMAAIRETLRAAAPQSRIQKLEAFVNAVDSTDEIVAIRINRLRDCITQANEGAVDGRYDRAGLALIGRAELMRREIEALPYTLHGAHFKGKKRGPELLTRNAEEILKVHGAEYPAKSVWRDLENAGKIPAGTAMPKTFNDRITRIRKRIR